MSIQDRRRLYDIELIVDDIRNFPQTYKTILGELYDDGTCQQIIRRKLSKVTKEGRVCKMRVPGTRFGLVVYYTVPKDYTIVVIAERARAPRVVVFFEFEQLTKFYMRIDEYWELGECCWKEKNDLTVFMGNVSAWI